MQEIATVNEGTSDQEFFVDNPCCSLTANGNAVNVKTLERCFNEWIDRERVNLLALSKGGFKTQF